MTKTSTQLMSVFALSAAALFIEGCKQEPTTEPGTTAGDTAGDSAGKPDVAEPDVTAQGGDPNEVVKCFGINECAGQSACNVNKPELGIEHACAGENACKGKGWIKVPRSECDDKKGEVLG